MFCPDERPRNMMQLLWMASGSFTQCEWQKHPTAQARMVAEDQHGMRLCSMQAPARCKPGHFQPARDTHTWNDKITQDSRCRHSVLSLARFIQFSWVLAN